MPNLGSLFEAYGETSAPFFKGLADAEQAHQDQSAKNIEQWLQQQRFGQEKKEFATRQGQVSQEMDLRKQEFDLRKRKEEQTMKFDLEDQIRQRQLREELAKVDYSDPEAAQKQIRGIMLKYADPDKAAGLLKPTPREEKLQRFKESAPSYQSRLQIMKITNPQDAAEYEAAIASGDPDQVLRTEENISRRIELRNQHLEQARKDQAIEAENKRAHDEAASYHKDLIRVREDEVRARAAERADRLKDAKESKDIRALAELRHSLDDEKATLQKEINSKRDAVKQMQKSGIDPTTPEFLEALADIKMLQMEIKDIDGKIKATHSAVMGQFSPKPEYVPGTTLGAPSPKPKVTRIE